MTDTIAAAATPAIPSAIGILRLSGPRALEIVSLQFRPAGGGCLEDHPPRRLIYGTLLDQDGLPIDQVLATWSPAPHSYTGEQTAELQCHGSPAVLAMGLEGLFRQGARQALPGEFTQRAFLNGKLDLAQVEAVIDLIDAQSAAAVHSACGQLSGVLSRRIEGIYNGLTDLLAHFHAVLDYPDEDIDPFTADTIRQALETAASQLHALLDTYSRGQLIAHGVPCAIVGRPNAGKSSLLNALLGYERAIVTDIPGTTRDTIEETLTLGGVLLRLMDTAGLRQTSDPIEQLGVERTRAAMEQARLILLLADGAQPFTGADAGLLAAARACAPTLLVRTKADLPPCPDWPREEQSVAVSAKTGQGLDALCAQVAQLFPAGAEHAGELLTNARQAQAAGRAAQAVERARQALDAGVTPDALLTDVEQALEALGELTGRSIREDITQRIFSRFCVGK